MSSSKKVVLAFAACVITLQAYPLESLRVEGNHEIPSERIIAISGLKLGQSVQKDDFEAARNRLIETKAFETVGYEYKPNARGTGYDAVLNVMEAGPLYPYRFEDLPVADDVLRAALHRQEPLLADRIPPVKEIIERYARTIQQATGVAVAGAFDSDSPDKLAIVFRPTTPRPRIAEVRFAGNDALPSTLLVRTFSEVAIGVAYSESAVRLRLDTAIRKLYEARGRIRVAFPKIVTEPSPKVDGVVVTISVSEGPVYNLGSVRFTGVALAEAAQLEKTADFKKGDVANFDDINAGLERVYKRYRNMGYIHVTSNITRDIDDQKHTVDLAIAIAPGPQYRFGKIEIVGLNIITEPAIRKAFGALEGKPYQPDYAEAFLTRLREEGDFENLGKTRAEAHINEESKTVDVTLYFSAAPPKPERHGPFQ